MSIRRWSATATIILAASTALLGKGVTTRITIVGGALAAPVAMTDTAVLLNFNVWDGRGTYVNGVERAMSICQAPTIRRRIA